jgi:hypothetical protein
VPAGRAPPNPGAPRLPPRLPGRREAGRQLELLGADTDAADAAASEFLPNGNKLNLVMADAGGSLSVFAYDAQVRRRGLGRARLLSCVPVHGQGPGSGEGRRQQGGPPASYSQAHMLTFAARAPRQDPESWGGKKLMRRGAAHTGALATRLARMRMALPPAAGNRQALLAATREGGVGLVACCWDEDMARRLASLQVRRPAACGARAAPALC